MACSAGQVGVAISKRETGFAVIKYGVKESIKARMTRFAIGGFKLRRQWAGPPRNCQVRGIRGLLKISHVTRITIG